ncbi:MAG: glycoside hydrolase family 28 protein [Breznakibacter sp.]
MNKYLFVIISVLLPLVGSAKVYDIRKMGADAKGGAKCTHIIRKAIERASADGGGTVYFPAGKYLTGPIHMKSNITLYLESGALVKFSDDFDDYLPYVNVRYEGIFMNTFSPLIYAKGAENIAIKGEGEIDGNGFKWWEAGKSVTAEVRQNGSVARPDKYQRLWIEENPGLAGQAYFRNLYFRPPFIQFQECNRVVIEGITIRNSPFWTINPEGCNDLKVHGVSIFNPSSNPKGPNTDGINPSSCSNVRISDCLISVGDDCITIKSGRDHYGREYGRPCENITITNCVMQSGHGGVVIGSEMSGGVKDITISNCVFNGTDNGIRLKSARGRGGVVENIRVDNIVMRDIGRDAFIFDLFYDKGSKEEPVTERTPIFRNIHVSNVTGIGINKIGYISGIEEMPVEELSFSHVNMVGKQGFSANLAKNLHFVNVDFAVEQGPSFTFSDCDGVVLRDVRSKAPLADQPVLKIDRSVNILVDGCFPKVFTPVFSETSGSTVVWGQNYFGLVGENGIAHKE